jgi:hypothetical protein
MNDQYPAGEVRIGRLISTDLSAVFAEIPLYTEDGTALLLRNGDRLIISNVVVNNEITAKRVRIMWDDSANGIGNSGEELLTISFAAGGFVQLAGLDLASRKVAGAGAGGGIRLRATTSPAFGDLGATGNVSIFITAKIIRS